MIVPIFIFAFALTANASFLNWDGGGCDQCFDSEDECCPSVDVDNHNWSSLNTSAGVTANTGQNTANWNAGLGKIDTGHITGLATVDQQASFNTTEIGMPSGGSVWVYNDNWSDLTANAGITANTGQNVANGNEGSTVERMPCLPKVTVTTAGRGVITTGNVNASAGAWQVAGVNMTRVNAPDVD